VCRLYPAQGDCRGNFRRFYHDARTGQCREFVYTGCKGNANNFNTREACGYKCGDGMYIISTAFYLKRLNLSVIIEKKYHFVNHFKLKFIII
jgi:hypothetical protein